MTVASTRLDDQFVGRNARLPSVLGEDMPIGRERFGWGVAELLGELDDRRPAFAPIPTTAVAEWKRRLRQLFQSSERTQSPSSRENSGIGAIQCDVVDPPVEVFTEGGQQVDGSIDPARLLQLALAVAGVLYTALTGQPPFPRPTAAATAHAHLTAPPPRLAQPEAKALGAVIARGLAKRRGERFATPGELARAARAALPRAAVPAPRRRRVRLSVFQRVGSSGYAVLGQARSARQALALAMAVARLVRPR